MSKPRWFWIFGLGGLALTLALVAEAGSLKVAKSVGELSLEDGRLASRLQAPKQAPHASNHGSTIAADREGLWIVERNAGALIRTDHAGEVKSTITLSAGLGELVLDDAQTRLFVADRGADRVIQYEIAGDVATPRSELKVAEPHGLALTPDGSTLLITSVADQELVAVEVATMKVKWRLEVGPEPRAVAVSPEGRWALVGFLTSETIVRVELSNQHVQWHSLAPRDHVQIDEPGAMIGPIDRAFEAVSRFEVPNDVGRRHVRSVFALGFVGDGIAVAAHHVAAPQMELRPDAEEEQESYGGGVAPIEYRFARITPPAADGLVDMDHHALSVHQPRALAYDPARDVLYIGGYGDDEIAALGLASREHPTLLWSASLGGGVACGIDGLAFAGDHVWAHCELARRVVRIDLTPGPEGAAVNPRATPIKSSKWVRGPELAASLRSDQIERGAELFRRGENESLGGVLACSSCHPEGRSDGLTWRLGRSILQTPILGGRVGDTGPYKWTGEDASLRDTITHTLERIGGVPDQIKSAEFAALEAYITSLPKPRAPSIADETALERGRALFERDCVACHAGEKTTDRQRHEFETPLGEVDTPSLIGLAHTAPYYHDGSAIDLPTLLDGRGSIHDMVDTSALTADERRDLITFLESL